MRVRSGKASPEAAWWYGGMMGSWRMDIPTWKGIVPHEQAHGNRDGKTRIL